jgi:hypothetical protein
MSFPGRPHITVALDPGSTTGVAVFSDGGLVDTFSTVAPHEGLRERLDRLDPDDVVCERGPSLRRQPEACAPVERLVIELFGEIVQWVQPSSWKNHPDARLMESQHERDAARMGRYWLASRTGAERSNDG